LQHALPFGPVGASQAPDGSTLHVPAGQMPVPPDELEALEVLDDAPLPPAPLVDGSTITLPPHADRTRTKLPIESREEPLTMTLVRTKA
jgi:hypothetical protein